MVLKPADAYMYKNKKKMNHKPATIHINKQQQ